VSRIVRDDDPVMSAVTDAKDSHLGGQARPSRRPDGAGEYAALVKAAASGDRAAMESLLMRAQEVAYRFSLHVCGHVDEAEDVMQDALLKTFHHAGRIREPGAFRPWLYRTVRNACLMRRRRRVDEPAHLLSLDELMPTPDGLMALDPADPGRSPEDVAVNTRLRQRMARAIRKLPPSFRMVVFLREMEGLSTREVAEVLRISEANVKTRLHRARLFLRRELEEKR
jgi:RNA polymerase sigma-70 factor (ECF subfamily)